MRKHKNTWLVKHGMYGTRFYCIWQRMKVRCLNKSYEHYSHYGGRGIKVCDRWLKFENFRDDMYESYQAHVKEFGEKDTSIDRINVNGNYCNDNCRWATLSEQARNTTKNIFISFNGQSKTLVEWSKIIGGSKHVLHERLKKGWSIEKALTTPVLSKVA